MKKISITLAGIILSTTLFAQDSITKISSPSPLPLDHGVDPPLYNNSAVESVAPLLALAIVAMLIIQLTKYILEHKLKNKIINRSISEQLASSILEKSVTNKKDDSIKWAFLLLGLSGGLIVAYNTMPLHLHSLAIMVFSLGVSYLAYFFYLRR